MTLFASFSALGLFAFAVSIGFFIFGIVDGDIVEVTESFLVFLISIIGFGVSCVV